MQKIVLLNTLPAVFAGREEDRSEVWLRNVEFERGKHYLISAESGTGKSSLCSYIYGYRIDYSGVMQFDGTDIRTLSVEHGVMCAKITLPICRRICDFSPNLQQSKTFNSKIG